MSQQRTRSGRRIAPEIRGHPSSIRSRGKRGGRVNEVSDFSGTSVMEIIASLGPDFEERKWYDPLLSSSGAILLENDLSKESVAMVRDTIKNREDAAAARGVLTDIQGILEAEAVQHPVSAFIVRVEIIGLNRKRAVKTVGAFNVYAELGRMLVDVSTAFELCGETLPKGMSTYSILTMLDGRDQLLAAFKSVIKERILKAAKVPHEYVEMAKRIDKYSRALSDYVASEDIGIEAIEKKLKDLRRRKAARVEEVRSERVRIKQFYQNRSRLLEKKERN